MKISTLHISYILAATTLFTGGWTVAEPVQQATKTRGTAVAYPWVYNEGNDDAKTTAFNTVEEIVRKAAYLSVPTDVADAAWDKGDFGTPSFGDLPTKVDLQAYGRSVKASKVVYGAVSWHTRSIWVNIGPKTISTATVDAYVLDVASGTVVYKRLGVQGRSDERAAGLKIAESVLDTALITSGSGGGGAATPREQRAVQIALAKAFQAWVQPGTVTTRK